MCRSTGCSNARTDLVAGPGAAGALAVTAGPGWTFIVTATVFAVASGALGGLWVAPRALAEHPVSFLRQLAEGWFEVRSRPWFWSNLTHRHDR